MADEKISQLTELTSITSDDNFAIVDDIGGSPVIKRTAFSTMADALSAGDYGFNYNSMSRQALINGNFDMWQRSISSAVVSGNVATADKWRRYDTAGAGGTMPTVTATRGTLTPGDIFNSYYYYRMTADGASSNLAADARSDFYQNIEYGTRYLCGDGKKVTVSFLARSDIANKRLGCTAHQGYGSGGSPTALETLIGDNVTLTSSWARYSVTITTNTLASKTFGTANDDALRLDFYSMWGSDRKARVNSSTDEDWAAGYIDIAQVQLCSGDQALPFVPKSLSEEKRDCYRHYWRMSALGSATYAYYGFGMATSTTNCFVYIPFPTEMRIPPAIDVPADETLFRLSIPGSEAYTLSADLSITNADSNSVHGANLTATVASGLTALRPYWLRSNNNITSYLGFDAEI